MKAFLNWSGGKDSAFCLNIARKQGLQVDVLVTAVNQKHNRVSMHGVRKELLELQAASIQLPLHIISLPEKANMAVYEERVHHSNMQLKKQGFDEAVFGDIFLEDLRKYREALYQKDNINCSFPLWKMDSKELVKEFLSAGFKAIIVCVNGSMLDQSFCGRLLDESFLSDLPSTVDPCGENGEYHSFVFDGPIFQHPIPFKKGDIIRQEYETPKAGDCFTTALAPTPFYFWELIPDR
jgi:uncharacterized protein (TIGR00290 family)